MPRGSARLLLVGDVISFGGPANVRYFMGIHCTTAVLTCCGYLLCAHR
jgi:hypothetical protein